MNVQELTEKLGEYPPDMIVWQGGGGDPYMAGEITDVRVRQSYGRRMLGHEKTTPDVWVELS